jgi:formylglycine-generating enzyme required for sulfatase activity
VASVRIATFALDEYEVNVGRFRRFWMSFTGPPANGAGAHPLIADSGWQSPAWDSRLADSPAELAKRLVKCPYETWDPSGANDALPMNCVSWYEAFAFCAWDSGRLPTEDEWAYAAAGGDENRSYPWAVPITGPDEEGPATPPDEHPEGCHAPVSVPIKHANLNCWGDGKCGCASTDILPVGSKPLGAGRYAQMDLAGSMVEYVLDTISDDPALCDNCANLASSVIDGRMTKGAAGWMDYYPWGSVWRAGFPATDRHEDRGFRCARSP